MNISYLKYIIIFLVFINSIILASDADSLIASKKAQWTVAIDNYWGPGLPTEEKLKIFDTMWDDVDQTYGAFINLDINIDSLRDLFRPEIEAGVSKGRFVAIMNHFALALKDLHTHLINNLVNWTPLSKDIPLFFAGAWLENKRFGAVLTPLPDSSLLVLKVQTFQGLKLSPGDIILGYEGIPWKRWYR